ncbi:XPR1-like protein, partial [Mya arenaria]
MDRKKVTDESIIQRYFARFDENFFQFCDKELAKINTFFYEKISEATRKYASLKSDLQHYTEHEKKPSTLHLRRRRASVGFFKEKENKELNRTRKLHDMKLAFSEFYLSLILLQNYQTLNFTGFRKILKKHDKLMKTTRGMVWRRSHVDTAAFYTNKEQNVTTSLEGGNRSKAMKRLRVPPLGDKPGPWEPALRMYRGMFIVILDIFLLGINTYGWRSSGVNHLSTGLAVVWCVSTLGYLYSDLLGVSGYIFPLAMAGFMLLFLINPLKILHHSSRMWLLRILFRIFTSPFHHVGFADFWLADQLNSLVTVLLDFEFMACFYAFEVDWLGPDRPSVCTKRVYGIRTVISILPAWFRFAQCLRRYRDTKLVFPHIINAGKYSTSFLTAIFSTLYHLQIELNGEENRQNHAFFYLWIVSAVFSSCYTLTWDLKMDWGLLDSGAGENRFLREETVYAYKFYYYFAMVEDFVLRFVWSLSVSVGEGLLVHSEILRTLLASLEIFRRFVWNFFRLENEHLNNCGQFRAVRDISIAPIDSSDLSQLIEMMDEDDGAFIHRSEKRRLIGKSKPKDKLHLEDKVPNNIPWKFK